jgi:hypothetical protein
MPQFLSRPAKFVLMALMATLFFVWSIPDHTIALRYLLSVILLAAGIEFLRKDPTARSLVWAARTELEGYGLVTGWIVLHMLLLSHDIKWSWHEFSGQWLISTGMFGVGLAWGGLALTGRYFVRPEWLLGSIVLVFASQAAITMIDSAWYWHLHGNLPFQQIRLTGSKTPLSYVVNVMLAFLSADLLHRLCAKDVGTYMLPWPVHTTLLLIGLGLACTYVIGARNGTFGIMFLTGTCTVLFAYERRQHISGMQIGFVVTAMALLIAGFAYYSVKADPRWTKFAESARIAWDIDHRTEWRIPFKGDPPIPTLSDGTPADVSAFYRLAWMHGGLRLIGEYPLGVGYGRNAFGHAIGLKYGYKAMGHSHSGMIDWTLGVGIPGLLLWLAFVWLLIRRGLHAWIREGYPSGLVLLFVVSGFVGRSLLDSNMRDHMMEMFMMLLGILLAVTARPWKTNGPPGGAGSR